MSKQSTYLSPSVCSLETHTLLSSAAPLLTVLFPKARETEQFGAIKELVWLRQNSQTLTGELLCLRSYDSATEPPQCKGCKKRQVVGDPSQPARGPNNASLQQADATATHTTSVSHLPQFQLCPPKNRCSLLKAVGTTIQTMHLWMFL